MYNTYDELVKINTNFQIRSVCIILVPWVYQAYEGNSDVQWAYSVTKNQNILDIFLGALAILRRTFLNHASYDPSTNCMNTPLLRIVLII